MQSKTSIVMAVGNHPGALMDALAVFREADINLVMLESRPIPQQPAGGAVLPRLRREHLRPGCAVGVRCPHQAGPVPARSSAAIRRVISDPGRCDRDVARGRAEGSRGVPGGCPVRGHTQGVQAREQGPQGAEHRRSRWPGWRSVASEVIMIAGPCAVESWDQVMAAAKAVKEAGGSILRGGCFKPRSSPYSFQGLGYEASGDAGGGGQGLRAPGGHRGALARGRGRGGQEGRHPPDRGSQYAELLTAQCRGTGPSPGPAQAGDELVARGAAPGGRVHPGRWQPAGDALRAGDSHLRDLRPGTPWT